MGIPPEIAWIVPIIVPLIIGLLVGFIVKRTLELMTTVVALVFLLVFFGVISISYQNVFDQALNFLPRIIETGSGFMDILPYSSLTFIIGLVLGLWKG